MCDKTLLACNLCPNFCGVDRTKKVGACKVGSEIEIAKYSLHYFEEPLISGTKGSGTVFFCGCSLGCAFCQNYSLSRAQRGKKITANELADIFKVLEDNGAHNINLVTPTHYVTEIAKAFDIYRPNLPVVYNTHSYETVETLKIIDPYVDIYLPDLKFVAPNISKRYTGKVSYFEYAEKAIKFMLDSKKTVVENGLLKSGVIVRHLIIPLCANDSLKVLDWFKLNQKNGAFLSIMAQFTPLIKQDKLLELNRKITANEYNKVVDYASKLNLENVFLQELSSASEDYIPSWDY
ncbi:MAG: radical SAM protein [Clostridia bacterium]|nr:radical SAM protein [Clostridia bacterium]